jgi:hypothetical protein
MTEENIVSQEERNIYEEELRKDNEAFEAYLNNIYKKDVPRPEPPTPEELSFWRLAGLESSLFVMSAIGSALLSAIRTGGLFWLLEELLFQKFGLDSQFSFLGNVLGFGSMIFALLAFEGFLLGYGLTKGRESGKMEVSKTGLVVSLVTVISAGIFSSFSIVTVSEGWQAFMNIVLALITGGASALVAFYSSENLGFILNNVSSKKNEKLYEHRKADMRWREDARDSYVSSHYNIRHKKSDRVYGNTQSPQSQQQPKQEQKQEQQKKLSKFEMAYNFINDYYLQNENIPTNKTVSETAGVALGTSYSALQKFVIDNAQLLLGSGKITEKDLEETNKKYYGTLIKDFIKRNNRFLNTEEVKQTVIPPKELARFIVDNRDWIVQNNLVDEQTIRQAEEIMSGGGA